MAIPQRAAFTIAVGKPIYLEMAFALARSYLRWNQDGIPLWLVTDRPVSHRPADLRQLNWVEIEPVRYGQGFTPKLFLDKMAPADCSLFIDADCLCVRDITSAFDKFAGHQVSVIGKRIQGGEWFGNVVDVKARLGITGYPRFNGGVYYLERGPDATSVFDTARALRQRYDEIGFIRLRGSENDEVLISVAMEIHNQKAIPEDGSIMNSLLAGPGGLSIDVIKGRALLRNPLSHKYHNAWYELEEMYPAIVHFLSADISEHPYRTEVMALKLMAAGWSPLSARIGAKFASQLPWFATKAAKDLLRPFYRTAFGARPINNSR